MTYTIHVFHNTIVCSDLRILIIETLYPHLNVSHNDQSGNVFVEGFSVSIHDLLLYSKKLNDLRKVG